MFRTSVKVAIGCVAVCLLLALKAPSLMRAQERAAQDDIVVRSLGAISSTLLYQTHQNIGMLGDARAKRVYDAKTAGNVLKMTLQLNDVVTQHLKELGESKLSDEDKAAVAQFVKINGLLKAQGEALAQFWKSGEAADGQEFTRIREECWTEISKMLGLDELENAGDPE